MPDGALSIDQVRTGDRDSLTSFDLAFFDGSPTYDEDDLQLPEADEAPAPVWVPSPERRAAAFRLFLIIGGSAVLVLVLAVLRLLWRALSA